MTADKIYKIVGVLAIAVGVMSLTVGKFILAFVVFLLGFGIFFTSKKGSYNEKSQYDKKVATNGKSLDDLFAYLEDVDTPLGKCWEGAFKGQEAILYGPTSFKDVVAITVANDEFIIKNSNAIDHIEASEDDLWRLEKVLDTSDIEVTPKRFSIFVAFKVISAVFIDDLAKDVAEFTEGIKTVAPESLDMFEFFRHNNSDDKLYDMDDNVVLDVETNKTPLRIIINSDEGEDSEELARIVCQNPAFKDATKEVFNIISDGEVFGTIKHENISAKDTYTISTVNGDFVAESFMAVRKANVSANYEISLNGVRKAVVIGSANINFGVHGGWMQNNVICSFDDDYLVLYAAFIMFLMNTSDWLR